MTLKEADAAARLMLPVVHGGVVYEKIVGIGYHYDRNGKADPYVLVKDKRADSYCYVEPERCNVYTPEVSQ